MKLVKTNPRLLMLVTVRTTFSGHLDPFRIGRDGGRIAEEVVQHLTLLPDSKVEVAMEIQAEIPDGAPENVVRTVSENCRTLKFRDQGFESD